MDGRISDVRHGETSPATVAELAKIFDHIGAPQYNHWTEGTYYSYVPSGNHYVQTFPTMGEDAARNLKFDGQGGGGALFRCVTTPTN